METRRQKKRTFYTPTAEGRMIDMKSSSNKEWRPWRASSSIQLQEAFLTIDLETHGLFFRDTATVKLIVKP